MAEILIAEDHEQMRRLIVEVLVADGHEVRQATDTESVLEEVGRAAPDLLVLDLHMPGAGGMQVLREIRGDPELSGTRVLLLSGSIDPATDRLAETGADAHLPKPFPVDDLTSTIRSLLAG